MNLEQRLEAFTQRMERIHSKYGYYLNGNGEKLEIIRNLEYAEAELNEAEAELDEISLLIEALPDE